MKRPASIAISFLMIVLTSAATSLAESASDEPTLSNLEKISQGWPNKEQTCEAPEQKLATSFHADLRDGAKQLPNWSCADVFSRERPTTIKDNKRAPDLWWPVCAPLAIDNKISLSGAKDRSVGYRMLLREMMDTKDGYDSCTNCRINGYSRYYVPPSQADRNLIIMSEESRQALEKEFIQERHSVAKVCCGGNSECMTKFERATAIDWCKPQPDKYAPDNCTEYGTNFNPDFLGKKEIAKLKTKIATGKVTADISVNGIITLSPFLLKASKNPYDSVRNVRHELGHACEVFILVNRANAGDLAAAKMLLMKAMLSEKCSLVEPIRTIYGELFKQVGMSDATMSCLLDLAQNSTHTRFTNKPCCEKGCPRAYMDENYANWNVLRTTSEAEWIPFVIPSTCFDRDKRDSEHPLPFDELACFLKTPLIEEKTRKAIKCQE